MHSGGERNLLLHQLSLQRPELPWIELKGWGTGSGHKTDRKRAGNLAVLADARRVAGRHLVIEANPTCGAWALQEF